MRHLLILIAVSLTACGAANHSSALADKAGAASEVFEGPVPRAHCGPGSSPETGMQGQVSLEDRQSGRSKLGYSCNLEKVGQYAGQGASWQHAWYEDCAYYDQKFSAPVSKAGDPSGGSVGALEHPGVIAVDVSDPTHPRYSTNLSSPAMLDPWESLKVADRRGLLGGVAGWNIEGPFFFDVYDVATDCKHPALKASLPVNNIGHEGNFSFDGMTYYGAGGAAADWSAIDVAEPGLPKILFSLPYPAVNHGLATSEDGNRVYISDFDTPGYTGAKAGSTAVSNGFAIWDVTGVQSRTTNVPLPVSSIHWTDGSQAQQPIPVFYGDKPFILFVDEAARGAARFVDISDELNPKIVSKLKLEVHLVDSAEIAPDLAGAGSFGYEGHYCGVDKAHDPTVAGCSYFQSGLRVFDIRDPYHPREIAYYNPGGVGTSPPGSNRSGASTSGYPSAQVRFIAQRGEIWFTDQDNGFLVVRFTNGVWPFKDGA